MTTDSDDPPSPHQQPHATDTSRPHDALFKAAFENPEHAAGLLRSALPSSISAAIAWESLALQPGSFIDPRLADRHSDLLFSARLDGSEVLLYVLLEHQSTNDADMPLRMLEYLVLIWKRFRRQNPGVPLPLIVPFVLSHAPGGWTGPTSFAELLEPKPSSIPEFAPLVPNFSILLEDLTHVSDEQLHARALAAFPTLALWLLRDARTAESLLTNFVTWIATFRQALRTPNGMEAVTMLLRYIAVVGERLNFPDIHAKIREQLPEAEYAAMTIAEQLRQEGMQQGLQQGRQQGRQEGLRDGVRQGRIDSIKHLLAQKFGTVAPSYLAQVDAADVEQLDRYIDEILSASTLEDLFET